MGRLPVFRKKNSGEIARNRLKLLLISDKANCSPELVEMIREDMIHIFSKYMEIDSKGIELQMTKATVAETHKTVPALFANIPIRNLSGKRM